MTNRLKLLVHFKFDRPGLVAAAALLAGLFVPGCQSSPSHFVSPRVIGRVVDGKTHQPIAEVAVKRVVPDYEAGTLEQVKGGEILQRTMPARSKADGTFDLDSQKSVALFRDIAWFTVEISYKIGRASCRERV